MTLTSTQWRRILTEAKRLHKQDEAIDFALKCLFKRISPGNYAPFSEVTQVGAMCKTLDAIEPGAGDLVSYFIYDVPSMMERIGKCICTDASGKEYDAGKMGEYVKWVMSN